MPDDEIALACLLVIEQLAQKTLPRRAALELAIGAILPMKRHPLNTSAFEVKQRGEPLLKKASVLPPLLAFIRIAAGIGAVNGDQLNHKITRGNAKPPLTPRSLLGEGYFTCHRCSPSMTNRDCTAAVPVLTSTTQ